MDQINQTNQQISPVNYKIPMDITLISYGLVIILETLLLAPSMGLIIFSMVENTFIALTVMILIMIISLITFVGLRSGKKWGIPLFTILTILNIFSLIYILNSSFYTECFGPRNEGAYLICTPLIMPVFLSVPLYIIATIYLWFTNKGVRVNKQIRRTEEIRSEITKPLLIIIFMLLFLSSLSFLSSIPVLWDKWQGPPFSVLKNTYHVPLNKELLTLIKGLILLIISLGLRSLKRWALYLFTLFTITFYPLEIYILSPLYLSVSSIIISAAIQLLFLIYLWNISKKFT